MSDHRAKLAPDAFLREELDSFLAALEAESEEQANNMLSELVKQRRRVSVGSRQQHEVNIRNSIRWVASTELNVHRLSPKRFNELGRWYGFEGLDEKSAYVAGLEMASLALQQAAQEADEASLSANTEKAKASAEKLREDIEALERLL
jgi:hypothetical protein